MAIATGRLSRRDFIAGTVGTVGVLTRRELWAAQEAPSDLVLTSRVRTPSGDIQGTSIEEVGGFLGVPYGAPPVGANRFMPPAKAAPWRGVRDGARYGFRPIQTLNSGFTPKSMIGVGEGMDRPELLSAGTSRLNIMAERKVEQAKAPAVLGKHLRVPLSHSRRGTVPGPRMVQTWASPFPTVEPLAEPDPSRKQRRQFKPS